MRFAIRLLNNGMGLYCPSTMLPDPYPPPVPGPGLIHSAVFMIADAEYVVALPIVIKLGQRTTSTRVGES